MPAGVYVADCIQNGPVYNAGIQNGDVIVKIGEKNILSMKDYENQLEEIIKRSKITIVIFDPKQVLKLKSYWDEETMDSIMSKYDTGSSSFAGCWCYRKVKGREYEVY